MIIRRMTRLICGMLTEMTLDIACHSDIFTKRSHAILHTVECYVNSILSHSIRHLKMDFEIKEEWKTIMFMLMPSIKYFFCIEAWVTVFNSVVYCMYSNVKCIAIFMSTLVLASKYLMGFSSLFCRGNMI